MAVNECVCGCPKKSHRYGGGNAYGSYTFLSSCRRCDCSQYRVPDGSERGRVVR